MIQRMADLGCIDHPRCENYDRLIARFDKLGTWRGPPGKDWSNSPVELRNWWDSHGCVRCFLAACRKRESGAWNRDCRETAEGSGDYRMGNPQVVEEIQAAIDKWRLKDKRLPGCFHCAEHSVSLQCGCTLFDNFVVTEAGHTGWAYRIPPIWTEELEFLGYFWRIGEVSISSGGTGRETGDEGNFCSEGTQAEVEDALRTQDWQKLKPLASQTGNFEEAYLRAMTRRQAWYTGINNCNTAAYDVLSGFGASGLPDVYLPGDLFGAIDVQAVSLQADDGSARRGQPEPSPIPAPAPSPASATIKARPAANAKVIKAVDATLALGGRVTINRKRVPDGDAASRLSALDKDLVKDALAKMTGAAREAKQRAGMNEAAASNPFADKHRLATGPVIAIDTKIGWVSVDWA